MTTAIFLYIAILLPAIAFGSLNDESTRGEIGMSSLWIEFRNVNTFLRDCEFSVYFPHVTCHNNKAYF